ncbi:hypothetical protein GCM10010149_23740 [Nonomuraea roseoviolacea subsp. roseoviolacea]
MTSLSLSARVLLAEVATWARARQIIIVAAVAGRTADSATRAWAEFPANWCDRPGCPKCWSRGCPQ